MHTWIPFANFTQIARCLDETRLEKQCVDAWTLLKFLLDPPKQVLPRISRMPCIALWRDHEHSLAMYLFAMIQERDTRRERKLNPVKNDNLLMQVRAFLKQYPGLPLTPPPWLRDTELFRSHRSQLSAISLHYKRHWQVAAGLPFYWPVEVPPTPSEEVLSAERDDEDELGPDHPWFESATRPFVTVTDEGATVELHRPVHTSKPAISGVRVEWSGFTKQPGR